MSREHRHRCTPSRAMSPWLSSALGDNMSARLAIAVLVFLPHIVRANPLSIQGQSLIAFGIVAFWALVIESGIATLAVVSSGLLIVPWFATHETGGLE